MMRGHTYIRYVYCYSNIFVT